MKEKIAKLATRRIKEILIIAPATKIAQVRKIRVSKKKSIAFFIAGCPCPDFDCSLLNELAESCLDLTENENYQFCFEEQRNLLNESS